MSGNFVQRGEPAIFNKFTRTKAALLCGADIVVELPSPWACSFAENFAFGAVSILKEFNVNKLYFGSETLNINLLKQIAEVDTNLKIKDCKNKTYATLRSEAIKELLGKEAFEILKTPNNNLGIEYIKASNKLGANFEFVPIERKNVDHDSWDIVDNFTSATNLRDLIVNNKPFLSFVPLELHKLYECEIDNGKYLDYKKFQNGVITYLRRINDFSNIPDIDFSLEKRLTKAIIKAKTLDELLELVKTKRYTLARIRRIITNAYLAQKSDYILKEVPYINILGFTKNGEKTLKNAAKSSEVPFVTATKFNKPCDNKTNELLKEETIRNDIYSSLLINPDECKKDFTNGIIKLEV